VIALSRAACCGRLRRRGGCSYPTSNPTPLPTATPTAVPTAALEIAYIDHDSGGTCLMAADGRAGTGHASASGSQTGASTAWRPGGDSNPGLPGLGSEAPAMSEPRRPASEAADHRPAASAARRPGLSSTESSPWQSGGHPTGSRLAQTAQASTVQIRMTFCHPTGAGQMSRLRDIPTSPGEREYGCSVSWRVGGKIRKMLTAYSGAPLCGPLFRLRREKRAVIPHRESNSPINRLATSVALFFARNLSTA